MYGFQPRSPISVGLANEKIQQVKDFLQDHMDMLRIALQNVRQAQDHYKKYADAHRGPVTFEEGQLVFLRVPENSQSLKIGPVPKLSPHFVVHLRFSSGLALLLTNLSFQQPRRFILCFM